MPATDNICIWNNTHYYWLKIALNKIFLRLLPAATASEIQGSDPAPTMKSMASKDTKLVFPFRSLSQIRQVLSPVLPKQTACRSCCNLLLVLVGSVKSYFWSLLPVTNLTNLSSFQNGKTRLEEGDPYMQVVQINGQIPFDVTLGADKPQVFVAVQNTFFV